MCGPMLLLNISKNTVRFDHQFAYDKNHLLIEYLHHSDCHLTSRIFVSLCKTFFIFKNRMNGNHEIKYIDRRIKLCMVHLFTLMNFISWGLTVHEWLTIYGIWNLIYVVCKLTIMSSLSLYWLWNYILQELL